MYSITEIFIIQFLCFIIVFNSKPAMNVLKKIFPFFNGNFQQKINEFIRFCKFICDNNPLLLGYDFDDDDNVPELENVNEVDKKEELKPEPKYEDKYLEKFKNFPNEFSFNEVDLEFEQSEYVKIKESSEKKRFEQIKEINVQLEKINDIQNNGNIETNGDDFTKNINEFGINKLLEFFDLEEDYTDDPDDIDLEELYMDLLKRKDELEKELVEIESKSMTDDDYRKVARDEVIKRKLDKYIDNYVLECTPLGNIYMRYNNDKKSFEYFSNNSIPYRYLEPVGRKYVITYWCKPIFVDIEEELKKAEERFDDEKKKKEEEEKRMEEERKNNPRKILAQLKNYNKETKDVTMRPMKNRSNNNNVLPPQIKANLPEVNKTNEKQLLKENANRYTWEGRLTNFCPLKKIDRKILDKKLAMTYADFKKMQQEQQNKK